jgi:Lar family restriction alleviation protein
MSQITQRCPFCGGASLCSEEYRAVQNNPRVIACLECGATGPLFKLHGGCQIQVNDSVERAIELWNTRPEVP